MNQSKPTPPVHDFEEILEQALQLKKYVKIAYFDDIHAFHSVNAVLKSTEKGIELTTGDTIQRDLIVSIDLISAPGYTHIEDYTCDC